MRFLFLQEKIEKLQATVSMLLHLGETGEYIYADDLSRLNNEIYEEINELYSYHGVNIEQEAALCLAILMGYSVVMYANLQDELKKQIILNRSQRLFEKLSSSPLQKQLFAIYNKVTNL